MNSSMKNFTWIGYNHTTFGIQKYVTLTYDTEECPGKEPDVCDINCGTLGAVTGADVLFSIVNCKFLVRLCIDDPYMVETLAKVEVKMK